MQILTPSGYRSPVDLTNGAEVCAFDAETGAPIVNHVENIDVVDYTEWCRWWQVEDAVPAFNWIRVNGSLLLFGEQSIWRNGTNVCHAKQLVVGDEIYDDADQPITIASVEVFEDQSLIWYRFDIDGDHSYIIDGLTVHNASRYWVGGTGSWDNATTTNWAASSNGAGGQSVPGSSDTVTLDGNSGGGTITLNYGGTITIQSIAMGAFTGTFDNSVNSNDLTLVANNGFNGSGVGTRTIKLGAATYTLSSGISSWNFANTNNLTFDGSAARIEFTSATGLCSVSGGLSYGDVSFGPCSGSGRYSITGSNTFSSVSIIAPCFLQLPTFATTAISSALNWSGSTSAQIFIASSVAGSAASITADSGSTLQYCGVRDLSFTGSPVASNSFDLGNNSGITITPPDSGGGGGVSRARAFGGV